MRSDLQQWHQLFTRVWIVSPQEQPEPTHIEVVSVTEEDLPPVDTPTTFNVSPLGSFSAGAPESQPEEKNQEKPSSPGMPVTKVQPFLTGETG